MSIWLLDSQGGYVHNDLGVCFNIDSSGMPISLEIAEVSPPPPHYTEWRFAFDPDRISEYRLSGIFENSAFLPLNWSASFEVERNYTQAVADGLDIKYNGCVITEISVSPSLIRVIVEETCDSDGSRTSPGNSGILPPAVAVAIHAGGEMVSAVQSGAISTYGGGDTYLHYFFYDVKESPLDMYSLVSIEVDGESVAFR